MTGFARNAAPISMLENLFKVLIFVGCLGVSQVPVPVATEKYSGIVPPCGDQRVAKILRDAFAGSPAGVTSGPRLIELTDFRKVSVVGTLAWENNQQPSTEFARDYLAGKTKTQRICVGTAYLNVGKTRVFYRVDWLGGHDRIWVEVLNVS